MEMRLGIKDQVCEPVLIWEAFWIIILRCFGNNNFSF